MLLASAASMYGQDVVLVAITSQERNDRAVALERSDFVEGTPPKPSFVKVAKIFTRLMTLDDIRALPWLTDDPVVRPWPPDTAKIAGGRPRAQRRLRSLSP